MPFPSIQIEIVLGASSSLRPFARASPALQTLAGTFSDKASLLVDLNERALAMRTGGLPFLFFVWGFC